MPSGPHHDKNVWQHHAQQWARVGSPLRPSAEDGALFVRSIEASVGLARVSRAILLGVTPELALLPWHATTHLTAIDQSADMIAKVWPAEHLSCKGDTIHGRWQDMPFADGSIDIAVGDGSLNSVPQRSDIVQTLLELRRVLHPEARAIFRLFIRPERSETLDEVSAAVERREVGSMHALKWRVAMALPQSIETGVKVRAIRDAFIARFPDRERLAALLSCPVEVVATIDAYADSETVYNFPTLTELKAACAPYLRIEHIDHAGYELGERCPLIRFALA